jgi:hypothetical protein
MMKKAIVVEIKSALNHIENAYNVLKYNIDNEKDMNDKQRTIFYGYGIETAKLSLLRLVNARKGLISVTGEMDRLDDRQVINDR